MPQPKVSVIIPVYNLEKYVSRCLDSVIGQTLQDIEIICINDGSTDKSLDVLRDYETNDPRIRVFDKENRGQGVARNMGIGLAKGEYIGFVDGDDWVEADMYEAMYEAAKKNDADLHLCTIRRVDADGYELGIKCNYGRFIGEKSNDDALVFNIRDFADVFFQLERLSMNKIYKSTFLKNNKIFFSSIRCYEDNIFHFRTMIEAKRISITRKPFYTYIINREGASSSKGKQLFALFDANREIKEYMDENDLEKELVYRFDNYRIRRYLSYYFILEGRDKKPFFDKMKAEFRAMEAKANPFVRGPEKIFYLLVRSIPYGLFKCTHMPGYACFSLYMRWWLQSRKRISGRDHRLQNIDLRDVV